MGGHELTLYLCFQLDSFTLLKEAIESYFQLRKASCIQRLKWIHIHWLIVNIFTVKIMQLIPLKFLTCNRYCLFEAEIQQKYIIYVHPFDTWAVVTEHRTSPRCALIILPKAVITSPVRGRRPLSAKTSAKQNKGNVWATFTFLINCISYCWPWVEKHYTVRQNTVCSTHIVIHHFKIKDSLCDFTQLVQLYMFFICFSN